MDQAAIDAAIQASVTGPKRVQGDAGEVEQHSIADQLAASDRAAGLAAVAGGGSAWGGALRPARVVLPGAVGPSSE